MNIAMDEDKSTYWHLAASRYLARLGKAEYEAGIKSHVKMGRRASTYRYNPSQYHRDLIEYMNKNDEERFKALKGEQGYASKVGS